MLYVDANATTPCAREVQDAMRPFWDSTFANASSPHRAGRMAAQAVAAARRAVATCIDARAQEIVFTSGATESTNMVFLGLLLARSERRKIVVSAIEHKAVLECAALLEEHGFEVLRLPVTRHGVVDMAAAQQAIDATTALVSVQAANNEIGTVQPTAALSALAHAAGAFFHVDGVQALGKMSLSVQDWACDFASFSAHKIYGPKGVGALFVRGGPQRWPWPHPIRGGGQEGGLRSGTLNVPGIVGFGAACDLLRRRPLAVLEQMAGLRASLELSLKNIYKEQVIILGEEAPRLPNTLALLLKNIDANLLVTNIKDVMLGLSSACISHENQQVHVIEALGFPGTMRKQMLRISFLSEITKKDISVFLTNFQESMRILSCIY